MVTFIARRDIAFLNLVEIWQTKIKIEKFEKLKFSLNETKDYKVPL